MRYSLSVPATSANLGPGFDAVGIALGLRLRAALAPAKRFTVDFAGGSQSPSHDGFRDAIVRAVLHVAGVAPQLRVVLSNDIPLGKGLGSSAAAAVIGAAVGTIAGGHPIRRAEIARIACELEGHPDNALPAVFGSAVVAASSSGYLRLRAARGLRALVVVPDVVLATADARALLPERYARADVVFTAQRAALLGAALATGAWDALGEAMRDRVHQPYRVPHIPGMPEALALDDPAIVGSALSGAGPSLIALLRSGSAWQRMARRLERCFERAGVATQSFFLPICARGLVVAKA